MSQVRQLAVVLDTLVNPGRPVAATEIHGITDVDVADAPSFADVAPALLDAMKGSVFASYNVYFDAKFLQDELSRVGIRRFPPHPVLCTCARCWVWDDGARSATHRC